MEGTIVRLVKDKGFGFVKSGNIEYFFHRTAVKNAQFENLHQGQEVTFEDAEGDKGPRAEDLYV